MQNLKEGFSQARHKVISCTDLESDSKPSVFSDKQDADLPLKVHWAQYDEERKETIKSTKMRMEENPSCQLFPDLEDLEWI